MLWITEPGVFAPDKYKLPQAAELAGHNVLPWRDAWLDNPPKPLRSGEPMLFHGSLGTANHIRKNVLTWRPGAFCDVEALSCSVWYPKAAKWLLQQNWRVGSASELVANPPASRVFVRPDSPLKHFSGRVGLLLGRSWISASTMTTKTSK